MEILTHEKVCTRCKESKTGSEFYWKKRGVSLQSHCKACQQRYVRDYYKRNKASVLAATKKRNIVLRQKMRALVDESKDVPCPDCGGVFPPCVMQFDHVRGAKKMHCVSDMVRHARGIPSLQREIEKCEVVCANCHAIRTYARRNGPIAQ